MANQLSKLDRAVNYWMANLPLDVHGRIAVLDTLLLLLPRDYPHRGMIKQILEHLEQHEKAQLEFRGLLTGNHDGKDGSI